MSQKAQWKNQEQLNQLSTKELVEIILAQQEIIERLNQEIEKLKISRDLDSKISSKARYVLVLANLLQIVSIQANWYGMKNRK